MGVVKRFTIVCVCARWNDPKFTHFKNKRSLKVSDAAKPTMNLEMSPVFYANPPGWKFCAIAIMAIFTIMYIAMIITKTEYQTNYQD